MNKQRLGIIVTAGLGILATFLPWVKAPIVGSIYGTNGDGWITLILFAIPMTIGLLNDKTKPINGGLLFIAIVTSIIAAIIGIQKIIEFNSNITNLGDSSFARSLSTGVTIEIGVYLVILAGIALPVIAFLTKEKGSGAK